MLPVRMNVLRPHPVIRVVTLIVFIAGISVASHAVLLAGAVLLALAYTRAGFPGMDGLARMIMRLRWLFLAILLVYGWWTPGEPVIPGLDTLSPSRPGLVYGLLRIAVLVLIVSAVHLLIRTTESSKLPGAIMVITSPFLSRELRERFAVRLLLTLNAVDPIRDMVGAALKNSPESGRGLTVAAGKVRAIYRGVLERAGQSAGQPVEVHDPELPPPLQWLVPLSMTACFWLANSMY